MGPLVLAKLVGETISLSSWLLENRATFAPVFEKFGGAVDIAQKALSNPTAAIRRVGNTIVFGQSDGGPKILAFIEQTAPRIAHIEHAVEGLQAGQLALSSSLATLEKLSMVTLGLTALTPLVLSVQFGALNRRLTVLQKQIAALTGKFTAAQVAKLTAGLKLLEQGEAFLQAQQQTNAHHRLRAALPLCLQSMQFFSQLLGNELNQQPVQREEVRLLTRHLSVALLGVASCQIGLEQDQSAFGQSCKELDLLRQATSWVFRDCIGGDPAPYLMPPMGQYHVTLEFMAGLYQQARDAGAVDPAQDSSAARWFEDHRNALFRVRKPRFGAQRYFQTLAVRLQEAVAAVEEINRVVGLQRLVEEVRASGRTMLSVREEYRQRSPQEPADQEEAGTFVAWGIP